MSTEPPTVTNHLGVDGSLGGTFAVGEIQVVAAPEVWTLIPPDPWMPPTADDVMALLLAGQYGTHAMPAEPARTT